MIWRSHGGCRKRRAFIRCRLSRAQGTRTPTSRQPCSGDCRQGKLLGRLILREYSPNIGFYLYCPSMSVSGPDRTVVGYGRSISLSFQWYLFISMRSLSSSSSTTTTDTEHRYRSSALETRFANYWMFQNDAMETDSDGWTTNNKPPPAMGCCHRLKTVA